jgi:3-oxoadipate enol-lactonase
VTVEVRHFADGPEDAPVVVFSNSLGTTHEMWDAQAAALSGSFRVLRYENRGHGGSPGPQGPYSIAALGEDVLALLDRLGVRRFSFCGLSIGGTIGMWIGVNAADRLERLMLCCTSACFAPSEQWTQRAVLVRAEGLAPLVEATMERWFTPELHRSRPETVDRMRETFLSTEPEGYASCCEALAGFDMRGELGAIRAPTLVIAGAEDPVVTPEDARAIQAEIAGSRLQTISEARHLPAVERPAELNSALLDHLAAGAAA